MSSLPPLQNNKKYYYNKNGIETKIVYPNNLSEVYDEHGEIVERIEYDEHYGCILKHSKRPDIETLNPYGYTGREIETNELYYYRARYYDASTQRFLSLDPIGFMSGDFNFYRYVGNSPLVWKDSFGLQAFGHNNQDDWSFQASYQNTNSAPKPENYTQNLQTVPNTSVNTLNPSSSDYIDSFEGTSYDPKYENIPSKDTPQLL